MNDLFTPSLAAGSAEQIFVAAHVLVAFAGAYLGFLYRPALSAARAKALRTLGFVLLGLGVLGVIVGGARLAIALPAILATIITLLDVIVIAGSLYYALRILPGAEQVVAPRGRPLRGAQPASSARAQGSAAPADGAAARPAVPASGRRDARRAQKRRKR